MVREIDQRQIEEDVAGKIRIVSGGSENHLVLLDLKETGLTGKEAEDQLREYGIITNKNMIVGDTSPSKCTGLRLGTAAITTRGFGQDACKKIGRIIASLLAPHYDKLPHNKEYIKECLKHMLDYVGPFYK